MKKNITFHKMLTVILIILIGIFGYKLIINLTTNKSSEDQETNKNIISYKLEKNNLSDLEKFKEGYTFDDGTILSNDYSKIFLNKNNKIQYEDTNINFTINEIENVKSFLINENVYESEYIILTESGELYISNGRHIANYINDKSNFFREIKIENVKFTDLYSIKKYEMIYEAIFNRDYFFDSNVFIVKANNNKYYMVDEKKEEFDLNKEKEYNSLDEITKEVNYNTIGYVNFKGNDYGIIMLNKNGNLKLFKEGYFLENKFLLQDGTEAQVYKMLIEPTGAYVFDLYALSIDNKLYRLESPYNVTISTELSLKEINDGKVVESISYEVHEEKLKNITFIFEDKSEFIIDEIEEKEYMFNIEVLNEKK